MLQGNVCVIYNPASGRGRAVRRLRQLRRGRGMRTGRAAFWPTTGPGQAEELARRAAGAGFATVVAAGGDGTVHEVANGVLRAERPDVTLAVVPVGSANDYAHSLGLDADWWQRPDPGIGPRLVDVGVAHSAGRQRYFVNGLGLGFNGQVTLQSRRIKWLQGVPLYGLAVLRTVCCHFDRPRLSVRLDEGAEWTGPTLALSLALGRREGNFVVAPEAVLDDGLFDYLHVGALSRWQALRLLPRLFAGRLPQEHALLRMGRCRSAEVRSEEPLVVHLDGEMFCVPGDEVRELQVELRPRALRVLGRWEGAGAQTQ